MLTYLQKKELLKKEQKNYGEAIGKMIRRKFYDSNSGFTIEYVNNDNYSFSFLFIIYSHMLISVKCNRPHGDIYINPTCSIRSIDITIFDEYGHCEDDVSLDVIKNDNNYSIMDSEFIHIQNNIIVSDEPEDIINTYHNTLQKNLDLNFLESIFTYAYKKYMLMISTHYLANLDAAYTLLLINKQSSHKIPINVLKIIIAKLFFKN